MLLTKQMAIIHVFGSNRSISMLEQAKTIPKHDKIKLQLKKSNFYGSLTSKLFV